MTTQQAIQAEPQASQTAPAPAAPTLAAAPLIYTVNGNAYSVALAANGKILDQASACRSIIAYAELEDKFKAIRKAIKGIDDMAALGLIPEDTIADIRNNANTMSDEVVSTLTSLQTHMTGSSGFSVPCGTNATQTPHGFILTAKSQRTAVVSGARAVLLNL